MNKNYLIWLRLSFISGLSSLASVTIHFIPHLHFVLHWVILISCGILIAAFLVDLLPRRNLF